MTKFLHWLTALLIFTVIPLGIVAYDMPYDTPEDLARKAQLFSLHKTVGVSILLTALVRIAWALTQPKPTPLHPERRLETLAAETVHWLLYGSLVLVPLTGWIQHSATTGFAPIWWPFGQSLPFVPKDDDVAGTFAALHTIFERVLVVSLLLHIAGAIKHAVIDRDATLRRMLPGRVQVSAPVHPHRLATPITAALAVWALAIGIGGGLGLFAAKAQAVQVAELQEVVSDWQVTEGEIALTVTQFGSPVTGRFADWTAAITFDDPDAPGPAGDVTVEIAIGSLTLGSVTDQAMGPDFFDATAHPTATYAAELFKVTDGYEARGTLTLKGTSLPVSFPFSLAFAEDGTATMSAQLTLQRLDFGIGANMGDESALKFPVEVALSLTASRPASE
ncbi:cytochrome b/b6 domain-containing protein [Pseudaestuariivita atlantica]|uniref:cytochrome b/b6 domain-containing protein n=1 Tax=Pseudaestuariivita atlantica TaxID=1317121 RepID=UPI0030FEBCD9